VVVDLIGISDEFDNFSDIMFISTIRKDEMKSVTSYEEMGRLSQ